MPEYLSRKYLHIIAIFLVVADPLLGKISSLPESG